MRSKVATTLGVILLIPGLLVLDLALRDFVRSFRFLVFGGGLSDSKEAAYIGYANLGSGAFEAVLAAIFLVPSWLFVRRHLVREKPRRVFWIAVAIAIVLGICAGLL
jgi:hypothetical protein